MLTEINNIKQYESNKYRRWFQNEFFDLYAWQQPGDNNSEPLGFQLCYEKNGEQRALRYSPEAGYKHEGVDAPEDKPGRAMTVIFVADGVFNVDEIGARFARDAIHLPEVVREFVLTRIREYSGVIVDASFDIPLNSEIR